MISPMITASIGVMIHGMMHDARAAVMPAPVAARGLGRSAATAGARAGRGGGGSLSSGGTPGQSMSRRSGNFSKRRSYGRV
jgi:hypothetical protein